MRKSGRLHNRESERGETLIEILATLVLLGTTIVVVLGALFAIVVTSRYHRNESRAETLVRSYAETLKAAVGTYKYTPCAPASAYNTVPLPTSAAGYSATVSAPEFWDGKTIAPGASPVFVSLATMQSAPNATHAGDCRATGPSCSPSGAPCDNGLQKLTITVTSPAGSQQAIEQVTIYKRDARCFSSGSLVPNVQC